MWFPEHLQHTPDMKEFLEQIRGATHSNFARADDGPDLISMLMAMVVVQPTETVKPENKKSSKRSMWSNIDWEDEPEKYTGSTVF